MSRVIVSYTPPCSFTPRGSPMVSTRTRNRSRWLRSMRMKSTCSRFSLSGWFCQSLSITGVFSCPVMFRSKMVLPPAPELRILTMSLGLTLTGTGALPAP